MLLFTKDFIQDEGRILIEECVFTAPYPPHRHEFIELVYIRSGTGVHIIDGKPFRVFPGSFLFMDYGQTHEIIPETTITLRNILIEPEFFSNELVDMASIVDIFRYSLFSGFSGEVDATTQCVQFPPDEQILLDTLIGSMLQEYRTQNTGYLTVLRSGTQMIFTWLLRKLHDSAPLPMRSSIQDTLEYINLHFAEKMDLSDIAARGFYNPDYLSKLLKKHCGKSFSQYIKEKRIAEARRLLLSSELSVTDIMLSCGYSDHKLFYRHFKEIYHEPPGSFRRNITE